MKDSSRKRLPKTGFTSLVLVALVGLLALLALAACSRTTVGAKTTPTPDAATLLQQASKAAYKDVTFTLAFTVTTQGQTVTGTGSGKATNNPARLDEVMSFPLTANGKTLQVTIEAIADMTTKTGYLKLTGIPSYTSKWTKMSLASLTASTGIDFNSLNNFDSYQNVKVIGAETINSVAVWHIRADLPMTVTTPTPKTATPTPTAPATMDIYIRQDNDYLVKTVVHTTGTTPSDVTLTVTQYDSGLTIALPRV